jgi:hypothetical protein
VISDLLKDDHQALDEVLMLAWFRLAHVDVVIKGGSHNTGVLIAQGSLHFHFKLVYRHDLIECNHYHYSFFPNHLMLVCQ